MGLGFYHAFKAGISFGKDDMQIPETKQKILDETNDLVREYEQQSTTASSPSWRSTTRSWTPGRGAPTRSPRR